jgi:disulfide bond formation protein DsbB
MGANSVRSFFTGLFPEQMFEQPRYWLTILLVFALALLACGFILQYGFGVLPCEMCWWQRYGHMGIAGFAVLGLLCGRCPAWQKLSGWGIAAAALAGLGVACWQFAAQHGWLPFPAQCTSAHAQPLSDPAHILENLQRIRIVPCDRENFTLLGLSLAGWNIPAMVVAIYVAVKGALKR